MTITGVLVTFLVIIEWQQSGLRVIYVFMSMPILMSILQLYLTKKQSAISYKEIYKLYFIPKIFTALGL